MGDYAMCHFWHCHVLKLGEAMNSDWLRSNFSPILGLGSSRSEWTGVYDGDRTVSEHVRSH